MWGGITPRFGPGEKHLIRRLFYCEALSPGDSGETFTRVLHLAAGLLSILHADCLRAGVKCSEK